MKCYCGACGLSHGICESKVVAFSDNGTAHGYNGCSDDYQKKHPGVTVVSRDASIIDGILILPKKVRNRPLPNQVAALSVA